MIKNRNDWWRGCIIYQIYPRSFQDSNNDGIGDLIGITKRLKYIASLQVDAIWISPFFPSPMKDFGYDVSNYCDVDPIFGTLADFDQLLQQAHKLGLKVLIDLVISHSSDQHPWFQESRTSRNNPKRDWYVWVDPQADGTSPNNWLSIFGGPAWQWDSQRQQYYLHNFLPAQPDFNFHNPEVQEALLDTARFWLDRGVDGFRLDTVNFYFHDQQLRSNPALAPNQRNTSIAPAVNPYNFQQHLYSRNRPEILEFLRKFRAILDQYGNRIILGEVGDANAGLELLGQYTNGDKLAQMCYSFELIGPERLTAQRLAEICDHLNRVAANGWACFALSNHDVVRHATRWELSLEAQQLYTVLLLCLRGSVCIYQGEELGLTEADIPYEALQDPYGKEFWPRFKGRDGCRTPMIWESNSPNAGFSAAEPWLPIPPEHLAHAVETEADKTNSMLQHYQKAIQIRKNQPVLSTGDQSAVTYSNDIVCFTRSDGMQTLFCAFNLSPTSHRLTLPEGAWERVADNFANATSLQPQLELTGWKYLIAKKSKIECEV